MKRAAAWCGWLSILCGLGAAGLWIWSATVRMPLMPGAYFGNVAPNDPFYVAFLHAGALNAAAATTTAVSVALAAVERLLTRVSGQKCSS